MDVVKCLGMMTPIEVKRINVKMKLGFYDVLIRCFDIGASLGDVLEGRK